MVNIFLGPAGIPTITKDRTTENGIRTVHEIGLNAMEVEFVRGIKMSNDAAKRCKKVAEEFGVRLSVHAPYFINLASERESVVKNSLRMLLETVEKSELLGADTIAVHSAYYYKGDKDKTKEMVKEALLNIVYEIEKRGYNVKIGIESMAKHKQFGSVMEIIDLCKNIASNHVVPYVDWAHEFARNGGNINYRSILNELEKMKLKHINTHFSCLKYIEGKGYVDIHIDMGEKTKPEFEELAKEIVKRDISITIISESPSLEQDSLKMKRIIENLIKHI